MTRAETESGFTILELTVALVIMGILAAIAVPIWSSWMGSRHDIDVNKDVLALSLAVADRSTVITTVEEAGYAYASEGVVLGIKADRSGVCVKGWHEKGRDYKSSSTALMAFNGRPGVECPADLIP